jgi:hypothetical protein
MKQCYFRYHPEEHNKVNWLLMASFFPKRLFGAFPFQKHYLINHRMLKQERTQFGIFS